ncbi:MAG: hypothetical protein LBV73_16505 [Paraburkholderia sp.]|jgi:hypothetical protein|nr:hypothetical protein [Paraburkholderia sp.]
MDLGDARPRRLSRAGYTITVAYESHYFMRNDHQSIRQMNLLFQSACPDNRGPDSSRGALIEPTKRAAVRT